MAEQMPVKDMIVSSRLTRSVGFPMGLAGHSADNVASLTNIIHHKQRVNSINIETRSYHSSSVCEL